MVATFLLGVNDEEEVEVLAGDLGLASSSLYSLTGSTGSSYSSPLKRTYIN